ncbi:hypothetical protein [Streptosporangium carneum]|uniref:MFS transporter permease n=1 Tax=Streptosporangium carneum TaxID=47481 RepID=A0A9W6MHG6_9ACTN|nr:hypothetical protein [Streptosporangium carneum]GLK14155.1 hypothetical protein GCM10017600_75670 [Streptosporangium carneum]
MVGALNRWWFEPVPVRRITVLRTIVYLFLPVDMLLFTGSVWGHVHTTSGYQPVLVARLLHLPGASPALVYPLFAVVVVASLAAVLRRAPRAAGYVAALGYGYWALLAMSYGKVDHDHLALIVALFVLPTVGARSREAAGWAVRCVQIAVVAAYFLSAYAKIRHGGWEWPNGATFQWAISRRGTFFGEFLAGVPNALLVSQWVILLAETASPALLFLRGRPLYAGVLFFLGFHAMTWAVITIHFLPHVICLAAFLPLERIPSRRRSRRRGARADVAEPPAGEVGGRPMEVAG